MKLGTKTVHVDISNIFEFSVSTGKNLQLKTENPHFTHVLSMQTVNLHEKNKSPHSIIFQRLGKGTLVLDLVYIVYKRMQSVYVCCFFCISFLSYYSISASSIISCIIAHQSSTQAQKHSCWHSNCDGATVFVQTICTWIMRTASPSANKA